MITFTATQSHIINSSSKKASWLFDVVDNAGVSYFWSTKAVTFVEEYVFKIISFSGVTVARPKSEMGVMSPSTLNFTISNKDSAINPDDLENGSVLLHLVMSDTTYSNTEILKWKFIIKKADAYYQTIVISCEDFVQQYLEGNFPIHEISREEGNVIWETTPGAEVLWDTIDEIDWAQTGTGVFIMDGLKVRDVFPAVLGDVSDDCCIPIPFGECYIPTRSAFIDTDRYYVLGPAGLGYTISKVRTPRNYSTKVEYLATDYTFFQDSKASGALFGNSFRVFQPWISGQPVVPGGACAVYPNGDSFYDLPTKFSRSDTVDITNPADVIEWILIKMKVKPEDIDTGVGSSFAIAADVYNDWSLSINGAFWKVVSREQALTSLLNMCNSVLLFTDKIYLKVLSPVSQITLEADDVIKNNDMGVGTFTSSKLERTLYDSGNVSYSPIDDCQDLPVNALVPAGETSAYIDPTAFEMMFTNDSSVAAGLAKLYFQRKLWKKATEKVTVKSSCLALQPTDFVTFKGKNYGGISPYWTHSAMIDSMTINKDVSIELTCTAFKYDLDSDFVGSHSMSPSASPSTGGGDLINLLPFIETFEDVTDYDREWIDVTGYELYPPNPNTPTPKEITGWGNQSLKANLYVTSQGSGGLDVYDGKLYVVDHVGCAIKIYDVATGVLLNTVSTGAYDDYMLPSDIKVVDGQAYISFTYISSVVRFTLSSDGLNPILGTLRMYAAGQLTPLCGLSVTDNLVYVAGNGNITILDRDLHVVNGYPFNPDGTYRIPLGIYCVDDTHVLTTANRTNFYGVGDPSYDYSGVYRWDGGSYDIKYGTSGTGATEVDTATGVWYYAGRVFVTDGILGTGIRTYSPAGIPKVLVYDYNTGALLYTFGIQGYGPGQFIGPTGICVYDNIVYINDLFLGIVLRFSVTGTYLGYM